MNINPTLTKPQIQGIKKALADPESLATTLRVCIDFLLGEGVFSKDTSMHVDTLLIWRIVYEELGIEIPEENENRINALTIATQTDGFYLDPEAFIAIGNALYTGAIPDDLGAMLDDLTLQEMLWASFEVELNRGEEEDPPAAPGVLKVMEKVLRSQVTVSEDGESPADDVHSSSKGFVSEIKADLVEQLDATKLPWEQMPFLKKLAHPSLT